MQLGTDPGLKREPRRMQRGTDHGLKRKPRMVQRGTDPGFNFGADRRLKLKRKGERRESDIYKAIGGVLQR